jgi:hypothetical protein
MLANCPIDDAAQNATGCISHLQNHKA